MCYIGEFNKWNKIDVKGPLTLKEFKERFEKEYGIIISMIMYGTSTVYNNFTVSPENRLPMDMKDAIEAVTKKKIPQWKTNLHIALSGNLPDGVDCVLPDIRYQTL
jgi:hypothetical protein